MSDDAPATSWLYAAALLSAVCLNLSCSDEKTVTPVNPELSSLALSASTVVGGNPVTGTVTLSLAAPSGGTTVALQSDKAAAAVPGGGVAVAAGATSATFTITTTTVSSSTSAVISGTLGAVTRTATLSVTPPAPPPLAAIFTVTGPSGNNTCKLNSGGGSLDCTFDGTSSTGSPNSFAWSYTVAQKTLTDSGIKLQNPSTNGCGLFDNVQNKSTTTTLQMNVVLTVKDAANNSSQSNPLAVTVLPARAGCGF